MEPISIILTVLADLGGPATMLAAIAFKRRVLIINCHICHDFPRFAHRFAAAAL